MGTRGAAAVMVAMLSLARIGGAQEATTAEEKPAAEPAAKPAEIKWYERLHLGGGVRAAFRSVEEQAANGRDDSYDFDLDSGRLAIAGKINDIVSVTLSAEFAEGNGVSLLDAIAELKLRDEVNLFVGRLLPACDRSNSDGSYYLIAWDYPELSVNFTNSFNGFGRSDGVTVWGDIKSFKYWAGAYEGTDPGGPQADNLLYAARLQYNFWDAEKGFYLSSTYHGEKDILALGLAANYQAGVAGVPGDRKNQLNLDVDVLFEKKLAFGVPTLEAAYYSYSRGGYSGNGLYTSGAAGLGEGEGFMTTVAFLIPRTIGWGELQPLIRYQAFNEKRADAKNPTKDDFRRWDVGVNYVISGHDARISAIYSATDHDESTTAGSTDHRFTIGTQVQF